MRLIHIAPFLLLGLLQIGCIGEDRPRLYQINGLQADEMVVCISPAPNTFSTMYADSDWDQRDVAGDCVLKLESRGANDDKRGAILTVRCLNAPPQLPGLTGYSAAAEQYRIDLHKRFPETQDVESAGVKLDGENGARIVSSFRRFWIQPYDELAMVSVHDGHVYLITATCPATAFAKTQAGFNCLAASWRWRVKPPPYR
jgi:hypothetical protein